MNLTNRAVAYRATERRSLGRVTGAGKPQPVVEMQIDQTKLDSHNSSSDNALDPIMWSRIRDRHQVRVDRRAPDTSRRDLA
jgi:hypothetical protein